MGAKSITLIKPQTDPAQAAALDEKAVARADAVAVDAFGGDLVAASPLQRKVLVQSCLFIRKNRPFYTHSKPSLAFLSWSLG